MRIRLGFVSSFLIIVGGVYVNATYLQDNFIEWACSQLPTLSEYCTPEQITTVFGFSLIVIGILGSIKLGRRGYNNYNSNYKSNYNSNYKKKGWR
ncbi:hypothetical protein GYY_03060 [Methanococcus maripaludis X1]|uniref:Uncharacterized protein n=1 Tax=Methanococcus maripaludis X1 TaxID=1053692 RepID=G0H425_METMI|nr:hypothetical protein [Methanococcus maripaludis]AEK19491.1 hypothetical protein GYY_03060 [Methanococcus maripaludis X1]